MSKDYEVLSDLRDHVLNLLIKDGVEKSKSETLAQKIQTHFRNHWGGQTIYFTKSKDLSERDATIYKKWQEGVAKETIIREYKISEVWFYRIVEAGREAYIKSVQKRLL